MKLFKTIGIVGTGLIGGSLALAVKKNRLAETVIGVSRHEKTLRLAKQSKAIDIGSQDLAVLCGADAIVLATPVSVILAQAPAIAKIIDSRCIVTDVGSTKGQIVSGLTKIFPRFVGSHPLAGSEKRGIINAKAGLFEDSLCIVTPVRSSDAAAVKKIKALWSAVGARVSVLDPLTHDAVLSYVSHLPHVVAFSLINTVSKNHLIFAPNSLKDTTRIAASDSTLWTDIFLSNRAAVLKAMKSYEHYFAAIKAALKDNDRQKLTCLIEHARKKREYLQ